MSEHELIPVFDGHNDTLLALYHPKAGFSEVRRHWQTSHHPEKQTVFSSGTPLALGPVKPNPGPMTGGREVKPPALDVELRRGRLPEAENALSEILDLIELADLILG